MRYEIRLRPQLGIVLVFMAGMEWHTFVFHGLITGVEGTCSVGGRREKGGQYEVSNNV